MLRNNSWPTQCAINKAIQKFQNFPYGMNLFWRRIINPCCT